MGTIPRSSSSSPYTSPPPPPPSHDDALDALDDVIAQTSDFNFVQSPAYATSPPAPNNPRQLDLHPELASFLQGIDSSIQKSPSKGSAVYPRPEPQTNSPAARLPSPRGGSQVHGTTRDYASPEPHQGYTVTPSARQPSPRGGSQIYASPPTQSSYTSSPTRPAQQQYASPPPSTNSTYRSARGSQQYASPPSINNSLTHQSATAMVKQAELQKIQQHRQHLLRQLNQLQSIENQLTHLQNMENQLNTSDTSYTEEDISIDEGYQPGASYDELMNSLPPPNSSIAPRKLADPNDYNVHEYETYASPPPVNRDQNVNNAWESKSMSLRPSQRPSPQRERFATVSSGVRPPTGLVLNNESILTH
jgi:hypothetical protein